MGAAAELRLADHLASGPRSVADLAGETGASADVLGRVLALLASLGLFERTSDGRYSLNDSSELLRSDHPGSVRRFCMLAAGDYQAAFGGLMHTLRTGRPSFESVLGAPLYAHLDRNPEAASVYHGAMADLARAVGPELVKAIDFTGVRTVVDIGGGRGTLLESVLAALPEATGVCLDRPGTFAPDPDDTRGIDPHRTARLRFEAGDFFSSVPHGADLYLLKNVLHNWSNPQTVRILSNIAAAMADNPAARLVVIEPLDTETPPGTYQAMDALLQAVVCEENSHMRTLDELTRLMCTAGLETGEAVTLATGHTAIEARPRESRDA